MQGGSGSGTAIPQFIRADFAAATRDVLYGMTVIMAIAALVALRGLTRGVQQDMDTAESGGSAARCPSSAQAPASTGPVPARRASQELGWPRWPGLSEALRQPAIKGRRRYVHQTGQPDPAWDVDVLATALNRLTD